MQFKYYVMNYDYNQKKVEMYNVFQNCSVQEWTEKAVRKYLRSPKKFKYIKQYKNEFLGIEEDAIYGFEALVEEIRRTIAWQERGRREYEINVSDAFTYEIRDIVKDLDKYSSLGDLKEELIKISTRNPKLEKWDCYQQCEPNMVAITHEVIRQYKEQIKNKVVN